MNVIVWNCRGTANRGFPNLIKNIRRGRDTNLLILMETHMSGNKATRIIRKLKLDGNFVQDAIGHSGGIWVLWDPFISTVNIISHSNQFVHMQVNGKNQTPWYLTAIYGAPQFAKRQQL